jgi:signal peptidase I
MLFSPSFRVSDLTLQELRHAGVRDEVLKALQTKRNQGTYDKPGMMALLSGVSHLEADEAQLIMKMSRQSLLRLERIIPNRTVREWADALIFAFVIAMIVRSFLFAPFKIPSGSMIPTIEVGDHIFATMYSYGLQIPFIDVRLFGQTPERGDIVIFPFPGDPSVDYIKRVIAKGGETVEVRGKDVLVDGKVLPEPYAYYDPAKEAAFGVKCDGLRYCGPLTVPPGHLFVMGDNRLDSADSRVWGFVDEATVKGRGRIIYWSHDPRAGLLEGYRLTRLGTLLH